MSRTLNFLAPSLHPNTLLDIAYPEPGPSSREPIVRYLAVKHGEYLPLGHIKRMVSALDNNVIVADDAFRVSTLSLGSASEPTPPEVISQYSASPPAGHIWAGLNPVQGGVISALSSGHLTLHSSSSSSEPVHAQAGASPLIALSSSGPSATTFAFAGKEVDVSVRDVERSFSCSASTSNGPSLIRKKNALNPGETWRARNIPNNHLAIRPPIHHLSLAHLPNAETSIVSGTKAGSVRRFDTRQRKPISDWKVAREGGVGCVAPGAEHELFFADGSNLVGALDLRTGRLLYSYSTMTCTANHLLHIPEPEGRGTNIGLATISNDATLRLHSTVLPPAEGVKRNAIGEGKKPKIVGMVGGVGVGTALWHGWGHIPEEPQRAGAGAEGEDREDGDEEEEAWEGMSEVEDGDGDSYSEAEDVPPKRRKK